VPSESVVSKEIRKETDWLGREKEVIYEDGEKTGEVRSETTFFGTPVKREYDSDGERVSETRHEHTLSGTPVDRTYDPDGERKSETRHEHTFFNSPIDRTYDNEGELIAETRRERTFFGTPVNRVYAREGPTASVPNDSGRSESVSSYGHSAKPDNSSSWSAKQWMVIIVVILALVIGVYLGSLSSSHVTFPDVSVETPPVNDTIVPTYNLECGEAIGPDLRDKTKVKQAVFVVPPHCVTGMVLLPKGGQFLLLDSSLPTVFNEYFSKSGRGITDLEKVPVANNHDENAANWIQRSPPVSFDIENKQDVGITVTAIFDQTLAPRKPLHRIN
jgi:hypothetical protein